MKYRIFSRALAVLMVISLLLSGSTLSALAKETSITSNSSSNVGYDDAFIKENDVSFSEKTDLNEEDLFFSEESMIPKCIEEYQIDMSKHIQRLTELEELNTYVFENADGTRSIYIMDENVKYIDENGVVKEKDISLKSKTGGYGILQSNIDLLIPANPMHGIDFKYSGFAIKLIPIGLQTTVSATQSDNSIVYDKAYGENTKLVYTPLLSGIKGDIVLSEYTGDVTYTFGLRTDGLNLYNDDSGYYLSNGDNTEPIFFLRDIVIYDAVGKPGVATMTAETISEGQEYLLTITADNEFLLPYTPLPLNLRLPFLMMKPVE